MTAAQSYSTMVKFAWIISFLCTLSWISVTVSEFHTLEVQPGEEVALLCSNFSSVPIHITWFKLDNRPNISRIATMSSSNGNTTYHAGFQKGKFSMTSNTTTLFLRIKQVDFSDPALYFCGFYTDRKEMIVSATYLKVQDVFEETTKLTNLILGALIIVLVIVIIFLVVKIRKHRTADEVEPNPQHVENLDPDACNYASLSFPLKQTRSRKLPSVNQLDTNVVYAGTR